MPLPDLDNEISELQSDEILIQITAQEQDLDRADALANLQAEITQAGAISRQDVMTAEAIAPGVLLDNYPRGGWTEERSTQNLKVSLEFMDKKMAVFAGIGVLGLLAAILRFFLKKDKSSDSSSGGGGVSSRDISETTAATATAAAKATAAANDLVNTFTSQPLHIDQETSKKFHTLLGKIGLPEDEKKKLIENEAEMKSFMRTKFMKQLVFHIVGNELSHLLIDPKAPEIHAHLSTFLTKMIAEAPDLIKNLNTEVLSYLTKLATMAAAGPIAAGDWPQHPKIGLTIFEDVKNYLIVAKVHDSSSLTVNNATGIADALTKHITELKAKLAFDAQRAYTDTLKDVEAFEKKAEVFLTGPGTKAVELAMKVESDITALDAKLTEVHDQGAAVIHPDNKVSYMEVVKGLNDYVKASAKIIVAIKMLSTLTTHLMHGSQARGATYITLATEFKDLGDYIGKA